jgi:hypothetical protein
MTTKIISFPRGHFQRKKQPPLSSLMIDALLRACKKQKEGTPFGPTDIKGSFTSLITRGLIVSKEITINEHTASWQVTTEAIAMLKAKGIEVPC